MAVSDWISGGSLALAAIALGRGILSDRKAKTAGADAAAARREAVDAQKQAADALARSAEANTRSVEAVTAVRDELAKLVPQPGVDWTIEHTTGWGFLLTNTGTADAFNVILDLGEDRPVEYLESPLVAGDAFPFTVDQRLSSTASVMHILWTDDRGEQHQRTRPLPRT